MKTEKIILTVYFYKSDSGNEPVRDWLRSLSDEDKKKIGEDIKTVQYGWPLGLPKELVKKIDNKLWEIRTNLPDCWARVLFTIDSGKMILLQGLMKKKNKLQLTDLETAKKRKGMYFKQETKNEK